MNLETRLTSRVRGVLAPLLATACLLSASSFAVAEDIDIYGIAGGENDKPNILIILDNSANWQSSYKPAHNCKYKDNGTLTGIGPSETASKAGLEMCALYNVIDALPVGEDGKAIYNVGLMLSNPENAKDGGYPRIAIQGVTADTKAAMKAKVASLKHPADKAGHASFALAMHEAYLYFEGKPPRAGLIQKGSAPDIDFSAFTGGHSGGNYISPSAGSCGRNYIILIANGSPESSENGEAGDLLRGIGYADGQLSYPPKYISNPDNANWADEYARFLKSTDFSTKDGVQSATTYTVGVTADPSKDEQYLNYMRAIAKEGGGKFYPATDVDELEKALLKIFNELAAVDSAFVSASLPVSVNSRGTYLNQVFMGMFRPDGGAGPRWRGNLKQYKFNYDLATDTLSLADSTGSQAINPATGFFSPNAVSFWTSNSTFWSAEMSGTPPSASDKPDGQVVEKGAAAQRLRTKFGTDAAALAARKIYTCIGCSGSIVLGTTTDTQFVDGNTDITAAKLGVADAASRTQLIEWVRGRDNAGDERGTDPARIIRPSVHGDVLHSRPVVVNYGGTTGVVVYYGANDGMLHAVNGNQSASGPGGVSAGEPYWSFVPEEGFSKLARLRSNDPAIRLSVTPADAIATPRDYFVDGPLSFYQKVNDADATEKVYLYVGKRRGGRVLYAFDVTNPTTPKLMWKKTGGDIAILGQTWSEPRVVKLKGQSDPILVMGAGYDPAAEDVSPAAAPTMGNAVLMINAVTGQLLKTLPTTRPVVADVSVVDTDFDGFVDRGYVGDLGGKLYRIDFETSAGADAANWSIHTLADVGSTGASKFFYGPDVVLTRDYAVVLVGTGDREKPLDSSTSERFFTFIDTHVGKGPYADSPITAGDIVSQASFEPTEPQRGCYIPLDAAGEKVVNAPVTAAGVTYFSTNRPQPRTANTCGNLGEAKVYGVPLVCGQPKSQILTGGGLPPSPVTGNVIVSIGKDDAGNDITRRVPFIIGGFNAMNSGIEGSKIGFPQPPKRKKLYWHTETER